MSSVTCDILVAYYPFSHIPFSFPSFSCSCHVPSFSPFIKHPTAIENGAHQTQRQ